MAKSRSPHAAVVAETLAAPYLRVFLPESVGGYSAEVVEFPGCFSSGETTDEAMANLDEAMALWIEVRLDRGLPIPPPIKRTHSKARMSVQMTPTLKERVAELAGAQGMSQNAWVVEALTAAAFEGRVRGSGPPIGGPAS